MENTITNEVITTDKTKSKKAVIDKIKAYLMTFAMCASLFLMSAPNMFCETTGTGSETSTDIKSSLSTIISNGMDIITGLATAAAAFMIVVVLFISLFSTNPKKIEESRDIAKKIIVTWALIMLVNKILDFIQNNIINKL